MKPVIITVSMLLWLVSQSESHAEEPTDSVMVESKNDNASKNWTKQKTTLLGHLREFKPAPLVLSKYGGRTDRKDKATGFFHTKQTDEGFDNTRTRGIGTGDRILRTTERPAHMAKNRLSLPEEMPLDFRVYAQYANLTA